MNVNRLVAIFQTTQINMNLLKHNDIRWDKWDFPNIEERLGVSHTRRLRLVLIYIYSGASIICRIHVSSIPDNTDKKMPNSSQFNSFIDT